MRNAILAATVLIVCVGAAEAGVRADLSGDAVVDFATTMDLPLMAVGNAGNADDTEGDGYGGVDYAYNIGKFEVTAGQYTEFLNAVADTDTYGLYNTSMWLNIYGCKIEQTGSSGSYTYAVAADWEDRPVNFVSWGDSARFSNWLTNGMPTGVQGLATTEDGSYFLNGAVSDAALMAVTRKADARYVIPSEDEWYKAAYHANDGVTANYFDYPTSSDAVVSNDLIDPDPGNNANFYQSGYTIGSPYYRTEAGEFELSESPYDTFDMGGNVWEWNEAIPSVSYRGLRGGMFINYDGFLHASYRHSNFPTDEYYSLGFRVSEVPGDPLPPGPDLDNDGDVDADDIGILCSNMGDPAYDFDGDGDADEDDLTYMVEQLVEWSRFTGESGIGTRRGDFNLDGLVNATDLAIMKQYFAQTGVGWGGGNANCDDIINATDLAILKANFGFEGPTSAVPEPATMSLLALGGVAMLRRKGSRSCDPNRRGKPTTRWIRRSTAQVLRPGRRRHHRPARPEAFSTAMDFSKNARSACRLFAWQNSASLRYRATGSTRMAQQTLARHFGHSHRGWLSDSAM